MYIHPAAQAVQHSAGHSAQRKVTDDDASHASGQGNKTLSCQFAGGTQGTHTSFTVACSKSVSRATSCMLGHAGACAALTAHLPPSEMAMCTAETAAGSVLRRLWGSKSRAWSVAHKETRGRVQRVSSRVHEGGSTCPSINPQAHYAPDGP